MRAYVNELEPVYARLRNQFGHLDAALAEIISGIEVVKASALEPFERDNVSRQRSPAACTTPRSSKAAPGAFRRRVVIRHHGWVDHAAPFIVAYQNNVITLADVIGVMGLMNVLRWPTFSSIFTFSLIQAASPAPIGFSASSRPKPIWTRTPLGPIGR
ncbi:MAG: hypothetical protein U0559_02410 [Anaerolineae bacterium]